MSKYFHNINLQDTSCKAQLPWELGDSNKSLVILEDISSCNNKGKTFSKKNDNMANPVVESNMKKLENQLIDVRKKYKERYYKDHFVKIKDMSINSPSNTLDDLIEINSENNNNLNPKDSLKTQKQKIHQLIKQGFTRKSKKNLFWQLAIYF